MKSGFADVQPICCKYRTKILNYVYNSKIGAPFWLFWAPTMKSFMN